MGHNIMVAFDDSENAMRAIKHVARFFPADSNVTLLTVLQDTAALCDMQSPELSSYFLSQQSSFCVLEEKKKSLIRDAQEKAKKILIDAGFSKTKVFAKTQVKKSGIARDIVKESESYDMIVVGRRGLSAIQEFFMGSVSQKILSMAKNKSVLVAN